ncbi:MAG: SHOCT domain-containing protein [Desulfobacteraceae bacterium]
MRHLMMNGFGWHGGYMGLGWIFWILIICLVVWVAVRLIKPGDSANAKAGNNALAILKERYAKGEIDREEFMERKTDLEKG